MASRRRRARRDQPNVETVPSVSAFCLITAAVAIVMRLCFPIAWGERGSLPSVFLAGDARAYHDYAAHIVAGRQFDNGIPFHPPGWAYVLAGIFRLAGFDPLGNTPVDPATLKACVAILGGLTVSLGALLSYRVAGRAAMFATGAWGSFHFGHMTLGTVPSNETLYGLSIVAVLLVGLRVRDLAVRDVGWRVHAVAALLGVGAGAAALVRAEFLAGCALLGAWLIATTTGSMRWRLLSVYGLGVLIVVAPVAASNWRSIGEFNERNRTKLPGPLPQFAPVTSYGAFNFAIANHPQSDGGPNNDHPVLQNANRHDRELLAEGGLNLAATSVHRLYVDGYRIGLSWLLRNPADALALLIEKSRRALGVLAHGALFDNFPSGVTGTRRRVDMLDPDSRVLWPVSVALLVAGLWMLRATPDARLLYLPLVTLGLSTLGFFGYVRLSAAYLPVIWVFQGAAASSLVATLPMPRAIRRRPGLAVVMLMLTLVGGSVASIGQIRSVTVDGPRSPSGQVLADETVRITRPAMRR